VTAYCSWLTSPTYRTLGDGLLFLVDQSYLQDIRWRPTVPGWPVLLTGHKVTAYSSWLTSSIYRT